MKDSPIVWLVAGFGAIGFLLNWIPSNWPRIAVALTAINEFVKTLFGG